VSGGVGGFHAFAVRDTTISPVGPYDALPDR